LYVRFGTQVGTTSVAGEQGCFVPPWQLEWRRF
jgi:hypothetical protein